MPTPAAIANSLAISRAGATNPTNDVGMSPLAQSYNQFVAGRSIGPALPRPFDEFLSGAFGPLSPLVPMPIDEPTESGRPLVRRWQYPVGWNLPVGQPGTEGLKLASFSQLRSYADIYSVVRAMLNIRKDELAGMDWDIGPTADAQNVTKGQKEIVKDQHARATQCVDFFKHIDPDYYGFQSWFTTLLEEMFVIDAVALHIHPTRIKGAGKFGSDLAALTIVNGQTIRPLLDIYGATPRPPAPAYQQYLWGVPRADLMTVINNEDLEVMGDDMAEAGLDDAEPEQEYRADQLLYLPKTRRVWTPYGFSAIEQALMPITIGIKRQEFLLDFFTEGTIPGVYVIAGDQYVTPAQQRQLQDSLNALAGDQAWKHRVIVLPPGSSADPQKDLTWAKEVDTIITEQVGMILHIQPHEIGMVPGGKTSGLGGKGMVEGQQAAVAEQRTAPDRKWWKETVFDYVIQDVFGQKDLEWKWVDFEEEEEQGTKATAEAAMITAGKLSIDETRIEDGLDPWNTPFTSKPYVVIGNQLVSLDPSIAPYPEQAEPPPPVGPDGKPMFGGKPGDDKPGAADGAKPPATPPGAPGAAQPPQAGAAPQETIGADGKPVSKPKALPEGQRSAVDLMSEQRTGQPAGATSATPKQQKPQAAPNAKKPAKGATGATPKKSFGKKMTVADIVKARIKYKDSKLPEIVHDYLLRSYPPKDVEWSLDPAIDWEYEPHVALSDINMARRPGGRDPEKVESIAGTLDDGASMDPMVFVDVDNPNGLVIADGWHRTLGAEKAGWKDVPAFIGRNVPDKFIPLITGNMQDDSDSKKAAFAELAVLRRYLRKGGDVLRFTAMAIPQEIMLDLKADMQLPLTRDSALERARQALTVKYSPDEARVDAGPGGGQWTSDGSSGDAKMSPEDQKAGHAPTKPSIQPIRARGDMKPTSKYDYVCHHCGGRVYSGTDGAWHHDTIGHDGKPIFAAVKGEAVDLEKDFSLSSPLSTGLVPYDLVGQKPKDDEERKCATCGKAYTIEQGGCPDHPPTAMKNLELLAAVEAELARRGVDIAKYSPDQPRDEKGEFASGGGTSSGDPKAGEKLHYSTADQVSAERAAAQLPNGTLKPEYAQRIADTINRGTEKFRAAGGAISARVGPIERARAENNLMQQIGAQNPYATAGHAGWLLMDGAVSQFPEVNLATVGNEVVGAHGFSDYRNEDVIGHGFFGTAETVPGTGSALAGEYIRQAAADGKSIEIEPVQSAKGFWTAMGMAPLSGSVIDTGGEPMEGVWGMSWIEANQIAGLLK